MHSQRALECTFCANREDLERVEVFKYLGRLISFDDADNQAMRSNLKKAQGCWARVSHVLRAENATPKTCGIFYKATVQAVLLYGSETWSLSPSSMKRLERFHIRAAWRMSGKRPERNVDGSWTYPRLEEVLEVVGMKSIAHYFLFRSVRDTRLRRIILHGLNTPHYSSRGRKRFPPSPLHINNSSAWAEGILARRPHTLILPLSSSVAWSELSS